jgi:uridine phosphorylase
MDIVVNELDALVNIDLETREEKPVKRGLNLIRIGTSGSLQEDIPVGTRMAASWSIGLDGLMNYYARPHSVERMELEEKLNQHLSSAAGFPGVYAAISGNSYHRMFTSDCQWGLTVAAHGFYGPQGRELRALLAFPELNGLFSNFIFKNQRITNFEMESSALYGLSEILGHEALTICLIIANRARGEYMGDYQPYMSDLIRFVLDTIV